MIDEVKGHISIMNCPHCKEFVAVTIYLDKEGKWRAVSLQKLKPHMIFDLEQSLGKQHQL